MLRVSILAVAAVMLAACDDAEDTVAVEGEVTTEPEVAAEPDAAAEPEVAAEQEAEAEAEIATAEEAEPELTEQEPEPEVAAEEQAQPETDVAAGEEPDPDREIAVDEEFDTEREITAEEEAEPEEDVATAEETRTEGDEGATVLTPDDPAVETNIITEEDVQEVEVTEEDAATTDQQATMAREGDVEEAMQSYQEWAVGRWAADANCESNVVVLQENAMSLPGDVNCEEVRVSDAGQDSLEVTGMSCEGAQGVDQVEIEVTQTDGGLQVARDGRATELTRCQ